MKDWKMMPVKILCLKLFPYYGLHRDGATRDSREVVWHGAALMQRKQF